MTVREMGRGRLKSFVEGEAKQQWRQWVALQEPARDSGFG